MPLPLLIFALSCAAVIYILFGYPLLLAILSRFKTRPVQKAPLYKTVSILMSVRNGEPWIRNKLSSISMLHYPAELIEVIVVSDGSSDRTEAIVGDFPDQRIRLLRIPSGGKAVALNLAMQHAKGEILFFTDVRQPLDPDSLTNLVQCFADPEVGVASGELVILEGANSAEANVGLYWKYEKWLRKRLSCIDSVLGATGSIYAMRRALAVPLPPGTLLDDVYQPLAAFFQGYRVVLDDTAKAFDFPTSLESEFHRKVRTLAGVYQIIGFYPRLLGPSNRMWIHFMSHKLGRLLLPHALILVFLSSFWLPKPFGVTLIAAQLLFYLCALIDRWVPEGSPFKRISSPVRTFVVLMAAAFMAAFGLFSSTDRLWKTTQVRAPGSSAG